MREKHEVSIGTVLAAPAAAVALTFLTGCGAGGSAAPTPEAQVKTVVQAFGAASAGKDYQAICDRLIAKPLAAKVEQLGLPCELAFKQGLQAVRGARLQVKAIRVKGDTALADVHSTAVGQPPSDDTIKLVRSGGTWRILSLSTGGDPAAKQP